MRARLAAVSTAGALAALGCSEPKECTTPSHEFKLDSQLSMPIVEDEMTVVSISDGLTISTASTSYAFTMTHPPPLVVGEVIYARIESIGRAFAEPGEILTLSERGDPSNIFATYWRRTHPGEIDGQLPEGASVLYQADPVCGARSTSCGTTHPLEAVFRIDGESTSVTGGTVTTTARFEFGNGASARWDADEQANCSDNFDGQTHDGFVFRRERTD